MKYVHLDLEIDVNWFLIDFYLLLGSLFVFSIPRTGIEVLRYLLRWIDRFVFYGIPIPSHTEINFVAHLCSSDNAFYNIIRPCFYF